VGDERVELNLTRKIVERVTGALEQFETVFIAIA